MCNNTRGSYSCICMEGFIMNEETKSCEGEKEEIPGLDPSYSLIGWFRY